MYDINEEMDVILKKNDLKKTYLKDRLEKAIRCIVSEYTEKYGRRIIVRELMPGDGKYPLLEIIADYGDIVAVEDRNPFTDKLKLDNGKYIDMVNSENISERECDVYIINSLNEGRTIYYELLNTAVECHIVELYTELRIRYGINPVIPYERYTAQIDYSHQKTHEAYELFRNERNEIHLDALLSAVLVNRDFVTFYKIIKEADDLIAGNPKYFALINDIDCLLDEVKKRIVDRKNNAAQDIIMHWIDQMEYDELCNFPKLQDLANDGLFFEKAYTVIPYTKAAGACLFYNDAVKELNRVNASPNLTTKSWEDSKLYNNIVDNGYSFFITGALKGYCMQDDKNEYIGFMTASSVHYWNMLNHIINSEKPVFGIIHSLAETHEPWNFPECNEANPSFEFLGSLDMVEGKIKTAARYYDNVIVFFTNMLTDNTINIYMSDHGKWADINRRRYGEQVLHTVLSITNMGIKGKVSRIFSYKYFPELINDVMRCAVRNAQEHIFGDTDIRSDSLKAVIRDRIYGAKRNDSEAEVICSDICSGYLGVKTDMDTYIRLNNGTEIYFLNSDKEMTNRITEEEYRSRIELLRKKVEQ